jgi:cell division protein FtsZ
MIEFPRATKQHNPHIRVVGLGGAGCRVLERLIGEHLEGASFVAMNTDAQLLGESSAQERLQLGVRGVGAGGDPDVGYAATDESAATLRASFEGAELVFLCAGLGGGTGSGGAPLVANIARQCGAVVVVLATLPFGFEGKLRRQQADESLVELVKQAQIVLCFENDRMGEIVAPTAPASQAFAMADTILCQAIRALASIVNGRGLFHIGLDEIVTVLRRADARCLFGHGESDSESRAGDAVDRALRSPLMNRGTSLAEARDVIVHVTAGADLSVVELGVLMGHVQRHAGENARLHLGVASDLRMGKRLAVTILSATGTDSAEPVRKQERKVPVVATVPALPVFESDSDQELFDELEEPEPEQAAQKEVKKGKAEQMQFEPVNRGRFEKSEPTIVDGQDLDVPTFLRKGLRLH